MRRPHSLVVLLIAVVITAATYFAPPVFSEGEGKSEHGFPFPWAFHTELPGSELPLIGPFVRLFETATLSFSWQLFLADVGFYCTILFFIFNALGREEHEKA